MKWNMLCTSINFNFKYHEIYIKTSFRTLRSLTFIKMWRVLISPMNSLQMPRNLKAFLLAQFKLRLQKTIPHRKLDNTTIPAFVVSCAFHWPYRLAHKSSFWARSAIVRARSASERASAKRERAKVPGPTTPDQKTKRTTLRKSTGRIQVKEWTCYMY